MNSLLFSLGLPQPLKAAHSPNNPSPQPRLKKSSLEVPTTPIPICSSTPIAKERPGRTFSARACLSASRIPCRLPNPGRSSGCQIRVKGGQGEKSEKVQKRQNPSPGSPDLPMKKATHTKHGNGGRLHPLFQLLKPLFSCLPLQFLLP